MTNSCRALSRHSVVKHNKQAINQYNFLYCEAIPTK